MSAGPVTLTSGGAIFANDHTVISVGQPVIGLVTTPPIGSPSLQLGFIPATAPACPADFNGVNGLTIDDLFLYINAWFTNAADADFNGVNGVTIDDLFLYFNAWFMGC